MTQPEAEELKPCPFCGSRDIDPEGVASFKEEYRSKNYTWDKDATPDKIVHLPACNNCNATTDGDWNARAPSQLETVGDKPSYADLANFASRVSELVWGGELGWTKPSALANLFSILKRERKAHPTPTQAVKGADEALTLAYNIITQEIDRINADDGSTEAMNALMECQRRIKGYIGSRAE